jgi:serine/threonine-protein kinase
MEKEASIAGLLEAERSAREEALRSLADNQPWQPDSTREASWAAEDRADRLATEIAAASREVEGELEAALIHDPDSVDAHTLLARRARVAMAAAEKEGQSGRAAELEMRLRRHLGALPAGDPERRRAFAWLQGDGRVTLHTDPPGARVELHRYTMQRRRLVPERVGTLGFTPLREVPLARGSWMLEIHHPGRAVVRYPVSIGRETHWDGVAPGEHVPTPIRLPYVDDLGPDDCYVPAGWSDLGGDPLAPAGLPSVRVWVDGFVLRRFPVTQGEYVAFLDDLVRSGHEPLAERYQPRDRGTTPGTWGVPFYGRKPDGCFELVTEADGDTWQAGWPCFYIDHVAAWAYARWQAARTGLPWRLPMELEWEKAARGVDRRVFPWGDHIDPTWCTNRLAFPGGTLHHELVGSRETDESPYGVRDLAGGVVEWSASRLSVSGDTRSGERVRPVDGSDETEEAWLGRSATWRAVGRGGSLLHDLNASRAAFRVSVDPWIHSSNLGFRLARSLT